MLESNQKSNTRKSLLKYAVSILSRRPYFRNTLREKILYRAKKNNNDKNRHCEEQGDVAIQDYLPIVDKILDELAASGYLDDVYLAQAYVRRQLSKCYGPRIIALKLKQLRLDSTAISAAIASEATQELQIEAVMRFAHKNRSTDKRKTSYKLYSRGFSSDIIKFVFDETEFPD